MQRDHFNNIKLAKKHFLESIRFNSTDNKQRGEAHVMYADLVARHDYDFSTVRHHYECAMTLIPIDPTLQTKLQKLAKKEDVTILSL